MQQREVGAVQKWVSQLISFDFEIQYKPGTNPVLLTVLRMRCQERIMRVWS